MTVFCFCKPKVGVQIPHPAPACVALARFADKSRHMWAKQDALRSLGEGGPMTAILVTGGAGYIGSHV